MYNKATLGRSGRRIFQLHDYSLQRLKKKHDICDTLGNSRTVNVEITAYFGSCIYCA